MIVEQSGREFQGVLQGIETAAGIGNCGKGILGHPIGKQIDAGAEGPGAIGGSPHTSLHLQGGNGGGKIGHVDPIDTLGFRNRCKGIPLMVTLTRVASLPRTLIPV